MVVKNTKIPRSANYGIELLFESKKNLTKDGTTHRNKLRLFLVMFLLTGLVIVRLHKYINSIGM